MATPIGNVKVLRTSMLTYEPCMLSTVYINDAYRRNSMLRTPMVVQRKITIKPDQMSLLLGSSTNPSTGREAIVGVDGLIQILIVNSKVTLIKRLLLK